MKEELFFAVKDKPLSVDEVYNYVVDESCGAINMFIGTVRKENKSKHVTRLEYESYDSMVQAQFESIAMSARSKWKIGKIAIHHRKGLLKPGDIAVVIGLSTPHRKESFEACSFVIEELKKSAPIWKKEIYDDGQEWLEAHP